MICPYCGSGNTEFYDGGDHIADPDSTLEHCPDCGETYDLEDEWGDDEEE